MTVDAVTLGNRVMTEQKDHHMNWIRRCVYLRQTLVHPPMSPRSLLMSSFYDMYDSIIEYVVLDASASVVHCIAATALICIWEDISVISMSELLKYYGAQCKHTVCRMS